jgi:serine protease Do
VLSLLFAGSLQADDRLFELEQKAIRDAVARVEPSVVQIETIGGLEKVGEVLLGTGPTTGLVVSSDGYVVSSAFNFAQKPATILVRLSNGSRWPAKLVATDNSRMIVLLKVQTEEKLVPAVPVPEKEIAVGQYAIAVGRVFDGGRVNVSEGIISADRRILGRALQTDAKVSPSNYGGPLVDIQGRVHGVLVPLSSQGSDKLAGVEWYDSGIGFAIPLEHVLKVLPRLKGGKDLHPGVMGVNVRPGNPFADPAVIAAVRPNSPAYKAGFKPGDKIIEVNGQEVIREIQVRELLGPFYAGDKVKVVVLRDKERIESQLELVDKLEPYARPFLGVLPLRVASAKKAEPAKKGDEKKEAPKKEEPKKEGPAKPGVTVRYTYRNSPADAVSIEPGDRIVSVGGKAVADRDALRETVSALSVGQKVAVEVLRGDERLKLEVTLAAHPEVIPDKLPPAMEGRKPFLGPQPPVGKQALKLAEFKNDCVLYVPTGYDPAVAHGVVIWLHEASGLKEEKQVDDLIARWKPVCEAHDLILVAPKSENPLQWEPGKEIAFVAQAVEKVRGTYHVDDARIVAHGYQAGGAMAFAVATAQRALVRGVAAVDAVAPARLPEQEPIHPLAIYVTKSAAGRVKPPQVDAFAAQVRNLKYPVTVKDLGPTARYLNADELAELVRWMDTLDRI